MLKSCTFDNGDGFRLAASRRPFGDGSTRSCGQGFALSSTTTEIFG